MIDIEAEHVQPSRPGGGCSPRARRDPSVALWALLSVPVLVSLVAFARSHPSLQDLEPPTPVPVTQKPAQDPDQEPAQEPAQPPEPEIDQPAGERDAALDLQTPEAPRYRDLAALGQRMQAWIDERPELARGLELPASRGGRSVPAIEWGAPGSVALDERPTLFLIGGLDGSSIAGAEAAWAVAEAFLREGADLPQDLTFVAVPWASPDGLARALEGEGGEGRNDRPTDSDADGIPDEDGPDDLDGDGVVLEMLVPDPQGSWARSSDPRFLRAARPADEQRYRRLPEGRDDDGDGLLNEDGVGGVNLDRHFPIGWRTPWPSDLGGSLPLSEPLAKALADLVLEREALAVLLFQGNHGGLAAPGGSASGSSLVPLADRTAFELLASRFAQATGRAPGGFATLAQAHGEPVPGAALDWFYAVGGALACEVAVWGPAVESSETGLADGSFPGPRGLEPMAEGAREAEWAPWLDNVRGGIGFTDWHPVELREGVRVLVGGFEPRTNRNPPESSLSSALRGVPDFVGALVDGRPRLSIEAESTRDSEVCLIRASLTNAGTLPTSLSTTDRWRTGKPRGAFLELELPEDALWLAGAPRVELGTIEGGSSSRSVEWAVLAPQGAALRLRGGSPWTGEIVREIKP